MDVRSSYDAAASEYAAQLFDELKGKPLDRHLLSRFAESVRGGLVADLGCGPGQIAQYLCDAGLNVVGIDISPGMIHAAQHRCRGIELAVGDITALSLGDKSLSGAVAFYSIVHFDPSQLALIFLEWYRVLTNDGLLLVAFHIGDHVRHVDDLWGVSVSLDFRFHDPLVVKDALQRAGFAVIEAAEREPYPEVEHQSRRCYLLAKRV